MNKTYAWIFGAMLLNSSTVFGETKSANPTGKVAASGKESKKALQTEAKITEDEAKATALQHVKGVVQKIELETEHGSLVYSVDVRVGTRLVEVQIDAKTGAFLRTENEDDEKGDD